MKGLLGLALAMTLGATTLGSMTLGATGLVLAQDADVVAGKIYATEVCADCHAIRPGEGNSPLLDAPSFQSVADMPGMTDLALSVWFQTSHPTMPNIILEQDDMRNVIAYIRSLQGKG